MSGVNDPRRPGYRIFTPPTPSVFQRAERYNEYLRRVRGEIRHYNTEHRRWRSTRSLALRNAFPMRYPRRPLRGIYPDIPRRAGIQLPDGSWSIPLSDRRNWRHMLGNRIAETRRRSVGSIFNLLQRRNVGRLPRFCWRPGPLPGPVLIPPEIQNHIASFL